MGVEFGIFSWIQRVYIVLRELLCHTECFCKIGSFIISNGSTGFAGIASDFVIAVNMDKNFIMRSTVFLIAENTMITVDVQNVGITEIMRITVKKQIVSAGNCIGFDPVAGQNGVLHAIIAYK